MSFKLTRQLQKKAVAMDQVCRLLEVSRSGYRAARRRRTVALGGVPGQRAIEGRICCQ